MNISLGVCMKLLFLDIDGVLNSSRSDVVNGSSGWPLTEADFDRIDPIALGLIRMFTKSKEFRVVISSSWRHTFDRAMFAEKLKLEVIGMTPRRVPDPWGPDFKCRGDEITSSIREWAGEYEITNFAIVDDGADMSPWQRDRFILVDETEGLLYRDYTRLIRIAETPLTPEEKAFMRKPT